MKDEAEMSGFGRKDDAWMGASSGDRPGRLHTLLISWRRMGFPAWLCFGIITVCAVAMIMPVVLLVAFADKLGIWWAILLLIYMILLICVYTLIVYPREMERIHYILGDELFFLAYPGERKKELRRRERERRRQERSRQRRKENR